MVTKDDRYSTTSIKDSLHKLLKEYQIEYYRNKEIVDRILLLLRQRKYDSVQGLIYTTAVVKYGTNMSQSRAGLVGAAIEKWWTDPN